MTNTSNYGIKAKAIAGAWYLLNQSDAGIDLEVLAEEIRKAMESAYRDGYQAALAQCECQPESVVQP